MSKTTKGARYIRRERNALRDRETVCTSHATRTSEITRLKSGAVKRTKLGDL